MFSSTPLLSQPGKDVFSLLTVKFGDHLVLPYGFLKDGYRLDKEDSRFLSHISFGNSKTKTQPIFAFYLPGPKAKPLVAWSSQNKCSQFVGYNPFWDCLSCVLEMYIVIHISSIITVKK